MSAARDHVAIPVAGTGNGTGNGTANANAVPPRNLNWSPRVAEGNAVAAVLAPKKSPSQLSLAALEADPAWYESARVAAEQLKADAATTGGATATDDADLTFGWESDPYLRKPPGAAAGTVPGRGFGVDLQPLGAANTAGTAGAPQNAQPHDAAAASVASARSSAAPIAAAGTHDKPITIDLKRGGTLVLPAPLPTPAPGSGHSHVHNDGQLEERGAVRVAVAGAGAGDEKHPNGAAAPSPVAGGANAPISDGHGHSGYSAAAKGKAVTKPHPAGEKKAGDGKYTETEEILMKMSNMPGEGVVQEVHSTLRGISAEQAAETLARVGLNKLLEDAPPQWYKFLWNAFLHPFNVLLLALAVVNGAIENFVSFGILCGMVFLSVAMRFWQEWKSALSAESLKRRITRLVRVRRPSPDGGYTHAQVSHENIVPGEVVELAAGDLIPGDVRVLESHNLLVNQSILTGESVPIEKTTAPAPDPNADQLTRTNLSFMGSTVETGSGVVVVVLTGPRTYFGQNAKMLTADRGETAFAKGVRSVSYTLVTFMAIMVPIVFIVSGVVQNDWAQAGLFAIAVAVGMTPEMLPMIVNSNLSLGAAKMARHKCVVKRLEAIQNIGAMDVLCTDKTGTLTMDRVQVHSALDATGNLSAIPLAQSYIIAFHQKGFRNVLDNAIVSAVENKPLEEHGSPTRAPGEHKEEEHKKPEDEKLSPEQEAHAAQTKKLFDGARALSSGIGHTRSKKVAELPFDFFRRRMSVVATVDAATEQGVPAGVVARMYTKGAMDEMVPICSHIADCSSGAPVARVMSPSDRQAVVNLLTQLNTDGLRVLAVAYKDFTNLDAAAAVDNKAEKDLVLCGLLTFLDPPKPDTHAVLQRMAALNVAVKVLTGDNILVAKKVCATIGIDVTHTLTGDQMRELTMDDDAPEVYELFKRTTVFARLSPTQKARVIRVLREHHHVVGMLGDGVNDALALKEADCGVSVDTGADLAKDAADMILTEKSLDVLHHGIVTGRRVHGNTIKYIKMTASSNFGNVFSLLIASAWLPFLPMQPVQLLLGNIIYDVSQLAIPWDQMDEEYLKEPKTWSAGGLVRFMIWMGPTSSIFDVITFLFAFYVYGYSSNDEDAHPDDVKFFNSMWFLEGLITQTLIVHMIRTKKVPFFQSRSHWIVGCTTVICVGLAILLNLVPDISHALDMLPVPGSYFGYLAVCMFCYSVLVQFVKLAYMHVYKGEWL